MHQNHDTQETTHTYPNLNLPGFATFLLRFVRYLDDYLPYAPTATQQLQLTASHQAQQRKLKESHY